MENLTTPNTIQHSFCCRIDRALIKHTSSEHKLFLKMQKWSQRTDFCKQLPWFRDFVVDFT